MPDRHILPSEPTPRWCKHVAVMGILLFWFYYLGWLGPGGSPGVETGFTLFLVAQVPLLWQWLRGQVGRWRNR